MSPDPDNPGRLKCAALRQAALAAEQQGDKEGALRLWSELRAEKAAGATAYVGTLRALRRFQRQDLAPPVLQEGLARFPDDVDLVVWAAELADAAHNLRDAERYWQQAVSLRPASAEYALSAALCLRGRRKRAAEMIRRLDAHHELFPDFVPAHVAHVRALRDSGDLDGAERLAADCRTRFPGDLALALEQARVLEEQKRFGEAVSSMATTRGRHPASADTEALYARALSCDGQHDEAERVCRDAMARFAAHRPLLSEFARIGMRRGSWDQALERLRHAQTLLPGNAALAKEIQTVRLQLADAGGAPACHRADDNLFAGFESLGGTSLGCEFGMVQQRMGSDAVGLLRWTRNELAPLLAALACEFAGVGEPENTVVTPRRISVDKEEWGTSDRRFVMDTHTFIRVSDAPYEQMFLQTCRRLRFLRGKLLEDLRAAGKMFVFKALGGLDDAAVLGLHAALARYGDNALLCVMRASDESMAGQVRTLGRGAFAGYVRYFMQDETGNPGLDIESWTSACSQARARWALDRALPSGPGG